MTHVEDLTAFFLNLRFDWQSASIAQPYAREISGKGVEIVFDQYASIKGAAAAALGHTPYIYVGK